MFNEGKLEEQVKLCVTNELNLDDKNPVGLPHGLKRSKIVLIQVTENYFSTAQCQLMILNSKKSIYFQLKLNSTDTNQKRV